MIEQQFLTTFNHISSYNNTARFKDKKTNLIIDFINGTYQGYLSSMMEPEGIGAIVDDEFNFILSGSWEKGKINGQTFIKLANQIVLWGSWRQNVPKQLCCFKIGSYVMFIPYNNNNKPKRPKKCLICNQSRNKIYSVMIQRYPEGTQSKREFSIIIEKIMAMKDISIQKAAAKIDLQVKEHQLNMIAYLNYMSSEVNALKLYERENQLFIYPNLSNNESKGGLSLGMLLDKKKCITKSVGMYSNEFMQRRVDDSNAGNYNEDQSTNKKVSLNGLGLSKTLEFQSIIGVFKDDMLIKQINSKQKIQNIRQQTKNFSRNLNGSVVKQLLGHEHMRSMSYQHNYLYFPEIKRAVTMAVEIHKYIDMFERLSPVPDSQSDPNQSMHQHHASQKYLNNDLFIKQQQSSGSIMDQYPEFKVNLKKDIYYREEGKITKRTSNIIIEDQNLTQSKRPGFILSRPTRNHTEVQIKKSKSPPQKSPLRLNKKFPQRSPLKPQSRQLKWKN